MVLLLCCYLRRLANFSLLPSWKYRKVKLGKVSLFRIPKALLTPLLINSSLRNIVIFMKVHSVCQRKRVFSFNYDIKDYNVQSEERRLHSWSHFEHFLKTTKSIIVNISDSCSFFSDKNNELIIQTSGYV